MNHELLRKAIEVIERIPEEQFDLDTFYSRFEGDYPGAKSCGTIACAAGWLAVDKEFSASSGLRPRETIWNQFTITDRPPAYNHISELWFKPLARVFGMSDEDTIYLFNSRIGSSIKGSDKEVWLARARELLEQAP